VLIQTHFRKTSEGAPLYCEGYSSKVILILKATHAYRLHSKLDARIGSTNLMCCSAAGQHPFG